MDKVYTLEEAEKWFLSHSSGEVLCCKGNREMPADTFGRAKWFFEQD